MPRIRVVTDSACDLPESLLRQLEITVVPHTLVWGKEALSDGSEINSESVLRRLRQDPQDVPEVEAPSIEQFGRTYRSLRDKSDGVISIHVTSRLSEAFGNASIAREAFGPVGHGGPFPVAVVDSMSMSMGLGWVVVEIARAAASGLEMPRLVHLATRLSGQTHFAFYTERLSGFLKTGRVPRLSAQAESLSGQKPLLHFDEGQLVVYEKTRSRSKARDSLYNFVEDFPKIGRIAVVHTGALSDLEYLMTRVGAIYPRESVQILHAGATVAAWLGVDGLGVAVLEGEEVL